MNTEEIIKDLETGKHVVKLWATWCGPCKSYAPAFSTATADLENIKVHSIDVDLHSALAQKFNVRGIPTTLFINEGKVTSEAGSKTVEEVKELLVKYLP